MKDMLFAFRKIIIPLTLVSFLMVAFFGFATMTAGQAGSMQGGCPFSATGASLCPQNALDVAIHHLSAYQSFLNVPIVFDLAALIIALFVVAVISMLFARPILILAASTGLLYESPPLVSYNKKLIRWLSLFELSPAS